MAGDTLNVNLANAYPSVWYECDFDIHVNGSIPVHFEQPTWTLPTVVEVNLLNSATDELLQVCDKQYHPGENLFGTVQVHLDNSVQQSQTLRFGGEITAVQYNEANITCPVCDTDHRPDATVVFPQGGEVLYIGGKHTLRWTASDVDGVSAEHPLRIDIDVDSHAGADGYPYHVTTLYQNTAGAGTYTWHVPNDPYLISDHDKVRVTVSDGCGAAVFAESLEFCPLEQ